MKQKRILFLVLTRDWYNKVLCGEKTVEYRKFTPYWITRLGLVANRYTHVAFSPGYTRIGRIHKVITRIDIGPCPYPGWEGQYFRIHFM